MSRSQRSRELHAVVVEFNQVHQTWVEDKNRPNPDATYDDAVQAVDNVFASGDIPDDCRELSNRVDVMLDEWERFTEERETSGRMYPHDGFWEAREAVANCLKAAEMPELKPLETIKELHEQGVNHRIIAKIWGFFDRSGEPMAHLVQRELDSPGSVIKTPGAVDGKDWVDPRLKEIEETQAEIQKFAKNLVAKHDAAAQVAATSCPETIEDLFDQGVSVRQTAKMLGKPASWVEQEFKRMGEERELARAKQVAEEVAQKLNPPASPNAAPQEVSRPAVDETTQAIYELADEGVSAADIAKDMKLKKSVVEAILASRQPVGASA